TEWAVLGLLGGGPAHGFALARELGTAAPLGRIITVRRPLVYRALDRLEAVGWCAPVQTEPGKAGPDRTVYRITPKGRRGLKRWLSQPVAHVRDLRIEFLLKVGLNRRDGEEIDDLVSRQQEVLEKTLAALTRGRVRDEVDLWRRHNARAVRAFLRDLQKRSG
ncbi:MAG: PadR family transcriptional regulator, partial [Acidimicrobiia bacterium]